MSNKKVYRVTQIHQFAEDSKLDIVADFGGNFEYCNFINELVDNAKEGENVALMAFIEENGAIFYGKIKTMEGSKVCIINRNGSDKALSRIIRSLKSLEGDFLFSDIETMNKIASRNDIDLFFTGQYDWFCVAPNQIPDISPIAGIEIAQLEDCSELVTLSSLCYQAQYPGRHKPEIYFEATVKTSVEKGLFHVIKRDSRIVAFCEVLPEEHPKVMVIANLFTLTDFQNNGFSTSLVNSVVKDFFQEPNRYAAMKINISNGASHKVAWNNGFVLATTISHCSVNPSEEFKKVLKVIAV